MRGIVCTLTVGIGFSGLPLAGAASVDFDRDIRPILSDRCFSCHGPDADAREADLRLDTAAGALADRNGSVAFRPGDPANSEAVRRIFSPDPDERMPPADSKLALSDREQQLIRRWVTEGAVWNDHWAFAAPSPVRTPDIDRAAWPRNTIDRLVLARLERDGLQPSPEASRETLIRRLTLDLTGLPPTPEEVDAFLADTTDDAYQKVVDRLLGSYRYGERMAWDWLDTARYADTNGFQGDPTRTMWPWRDWLIGALNQNLPFDEFTIQMLAGDLLPNATQEQVVASGFNRNHMFNGEGGRIPEETRVENVFDRTETTSTVWLGLTMTCARCHDHKFDPISQREYYQFYAFFNNTSENGQGRSGGALPLLAYLTPQQRATRQALDLRIAELQQQMEAPLPEVDRAQRVWEQEIARKRSAEDLAGTITLSDWSLLGPLPAPGKDAGTTFEHEFGPEQGVDLNLTLANGSLAWQPQPSLEDGRPHALSETVGATYLFRTITAPSERIVELSLGSDDGIKVWLNGAELLANDVQRGVMPDQEKLKVTVHSGTNELLVKIVNTGGPGGFFFRVLSESPDGLSPELAAIVLTEPSQRNTDQDRTLQQYYRRLNSATWQALDKEKVELERVRDAIRGIDVMVMDELPAGKQRTTARLRAQDSTTNRKTQ